MKWQKSDGEPRPADREQSEPAPKGASISQRIAAAEAEREKIAAAIAQLKYREGLLQLRHKLIVTCSQHGANTQMTLHSLQLLLHELLTEDLNAVVQADSH